jgi:hypothetical protein
MCNQVTPKPYVIWQGDIDHEGTSLHSITVKIPSNLTCDACTLQVRQWAPEFSWYYYSCSDVRVQARTNTTAIKSTCRSAIDDNTCTISAAPPQVRILILQSILVAVAVIVCLTAAIVGIILVVLKIGRISCCGWCCGPCQKRNNVPWYALIFSVSLAIIGTIIIIVVSTVVLRTSPVQCVNSNLDGSTWTS